MLKITQLILLILIGITSLSFKSEINLQSDKFLNEIFSKSEIKEIEKMVSYVDSMVLKNSSTTDINQAYHQFLEKLNQTIRDSSRFLVPFEEEKKYQFLESLDSAIFNDFWRISTHIRISKYKNTIYRDLDNYKILNLRPIGRYMDYLEKLGKEDEYYKLLKESIEVAGDLPAGIAVYFPMNHQKFDFNIPKNRLWIAVYILRIEEHNDKKMERYLKQRNSLDNEYFLLGTLSDYMGREKYQKVTDRVDRYYESEKKLCLALDSLFRETYPDLKLSVTKHKNTMKDEFELHSVLLADRIDEFYNLQSSGRMNINVDLDTVKQISDSLFTEYLQSADTIYCGSLKTDIFETDRQKLSFITGAFVRFGGHNDSIYHISVANSVSKVKVLTRLLEEMKCENVEYKIREDYIPVGHTVYFSPSTDLINYFNHSNRFR